MKYTYIEIQRKRYGQRTREKYRGVDRNRKEKYRDIA